MGSTTTVDTGALVEAGRVVWEWSQRTVTAVGGSGPALARVGAELAGSSTAGQVPGARSAVDEALGDLAWALHHLAQSLSAAAARYQRVEAVAARTFSAQTFAGAVDASPPPATAGARPGLALAEVMLPAPRYSRSGPSAGLLGLPSAMQRAADAPAWMSRDGSCCRAAGAALGHAEEVVRAVGQGTGGLLFDVASTLGWQGPASLAAGARSRHLHGQLAQAVEQLRVAGAALSGLGTSLDEHAPTIGRARTTALQAPVFVPVPVIVPGWQAAAQALALADRRTAEQLRGVGVSLARLGRLAAETGWTGDQADARVLAVLTDRAVLAPPAVLAVLAAAERLPGGPDGDRRLRQVLAGLSTADLTGVLEAHPDLARRLIGGDALARPGVLPPGSDAANLAAVLATSAGLAPDGRARVVTGFFGALSPDARRRLALLYPGVIGGLDGATLPDRCAANRVAIGVARDELLSRYSQQAEAARTGRGQGRLDGLLSHDDTAEKTVAESTRKRIEYYTKLLDEEVPNPSSGPEQPARALTGHHQILVFDPGGDGQIAELWGDIDADTTHVGVFVPGTTADMESFDRYSLKSRLLAENDQEHATAAITWLGWDAPDAIVHDAPFPGYADRAGTRLVGFTAGLGLAASVTTTVVGHSYGGAVVGVADSLGMDVDRVVLVESPGAGRGVFLTTQLSGESGRNVEHYTMTAPLDPIKVARTGPLPQLLGIGHGGNPDTMPGYVRLETGRLNDGAPSGERGPMLFGPSAHTAVLTPGSTAWANIQSLVSGGEITLRPPNLPIVPGVNVNLPLYAIPHYRGPKVSVP